MSAPQAMPTLIGDIVIAHVDASRSTHAVWTVGVDGQQAANPPDSAFTAIGDEAAVSLARLMRRDSRGLGTIYFFDPDTLTWTKLAD